MAEKKIPESFVQDADSNSAAGGGTAKQLPQKSQGAQPPEPAQAPGPDQDDPGVPGEPGTGVRLPTGEQTTADTVPPQSEVVQPSYFPFLKALNVDAPAPLDYGVSIAILLVFAAALVRTVASALRRSSIDTA